MTIFAVSMSPYYSYLLDVKIYMKITYSFMENFKKKIVSFIRFFQINIRFKHV